MPLFTPFTPARTVGRVGRFRRGKAVRRLDVEGRVHRNSREIIRVADHIHGHVQAGGGVWPYELDLRLGVIAGPEGRHVAARGPVELPHVVLDRPAGNRVVPGIRLDMPRNHVGGGAGGGESGLEVDNLTDVNRRRRGASRSFAIASPGPR